MAGVLLFVFVVAWVENLFPPSPSDVLLVVAGTLIGIGTIDFVWLLVASTAGSVTGFGTAYYLGRRFGPRLLLSTWVPFLNVELMTKVQRWFDKWHGWIIVANRFMAGTRAVIAFAAGIAAMPVIRTLLYCTASAALWNAIMLLIGEQLGARWRDIDGILATYGWIVTGIIALAVGIWFIRKRRSRSTGT